LFGAANRRIRRAACTGRTYAMPISLTQRATLRRLAHDAVARLAKRELAPDQWQPLVKIADDLALEMPDASAEQITRAVDKAVRERRTQMGMATKGFAINKKGKPTFYQNFVMRLSETELAFVMAMGGEAAKSDVIHQLLAEAMARSRKKRKVASKPKA